MRAASDAQLLTSEEFVTDLVCQLKLSSIERLRLVDTMEDERFAQAFRRLLENTDRFGLVVDFSLMPNPYHGDSSTLREALYSLREMGVVSINNPSFKTVEIKIDENSANYYLDRSPIPRDFMQQIVEEIFVKAEKNDRSNVNTRQN